MGIRREGSSAIHRSHCRGSGDGLRLPMTLFAIDAAHNALGAVGLGPVDDEVSEAERAGRTPWILGMVVAKEARMLGIGRRLLEGLQDAAGTLGIVNPGSQPARRQSGSIKSAAGSQSSSCDWSRPESRQLFWSSQQPFDDARVSDPCSRSAAGTSGLRAELLDRRLDPNTVGGSPFCRSRTQHEGETLTG